jgi:hypothetical protein
MSPAVVHFVERALERMSAHPASGVSKMEAYGVCVGLVQTHAQQERRGGVLDEEFVAAQATSLQHLAADGDHPRLAAALAESAAATPEPLDDRFARILTVLLDGLLPHQ